MFGKYLDFWSIVPRSKDGGGDGGGGGGNDDKPAAAPATTNQDRINEIYASSDNPWESNGAELNALVNDRSGTYSGGSTAASS